MADASLELGVDTPRSEEVRGDAVAEPAPTFVIELWERIRKHKVVQWTLVYAAAAYTLLHTVEMVSAALEWPHLIVRIVTLLLLLGVPVATTLAWFHGHRAQHRVSGSELVILAVLLTLAGSVLWSLGRPNHEWAPAATVALAPAASGAAAAAIARPPEKSIAVLPFADMSEKRDQEYFSDAMAEEIIDRLVKVPELYVPARTSSFYFKGKSTRIPDIAQELGVAHVLEGSVRRSGDHLRVTALLVRADNGSHVWSETYDRQLDDIFKVQDEIAAAVVSALKIALTERALPRVSVASNTTAYTLFLQGRAMFRRAATKSEYETAIDYLQRSTMADPAFASPWVELSNAYRDQWIDGLIDYTTATVHAHRTAERAVALDPALGAAHGALASAYWFLEWNWDAAAPEFRKAYELDPANANVVRNLADFMFARGGDDETIIGLFEKAAELDPVYDANYVRLADALYCMGRLSEAEAAIRRAMDLSPANSWWHYALAEVLLARGEPAAAHAEVLHASNATVRRLSTALTYAALGRTAAADAALADAENQDAANWAFEIAKVHAYRGQTDRAFAWLERAYRQRNSALMAIKRDPLLENVRSDPRYKAFLRKLKLPV